MDVAMGWRENRGLASDTSGVRSEQRRVRRPRVVSIRQPGFAKAHRRPNAVLVVQHGEERGLVDGVTPAVVLAQRVHLRLVPVGHGHALRGKGREGGRGGGRRSTVLAPTLASARLHCLWGIHAPRPEDPRPRGSAGMRVRHSDHAPARAHLAPVREGLVSRLAVAAHEDLELDAHCVEAEPVFVAAGTAAAIVGHPSQLIELRFRHLSLRNVRIGSVLEVSARAAGDLARKQHHHDTFTEKGKGKRERGRATRKRAESGGTGTRGARGLQSVTGKKRCADLWCGVYRWVGT